MQYDYNLPASSSTSKTTGLGGYSSSTPPAGNELQEGVPDIAAHPITVDQQVQ